jgi:hypothetical protein
VAIYFSASGALSARRVVTARGLIGSEKEEFFKDPRVIQALRKGGVNVQFEKAGSRQIATNYDLSQYDFAFPAGVPAAEKLRREEGISKSYDVFFTPMAIASWKPIANLLEKNGLAKEQDGYYLLDMQAYLDMVTAGKRWKDLQGSDTYPVNKSILINSTDVRKSNSGAMYLALASFVENENNVVQSDAEIQQVMPLMEELFLKQGYTEYSSEAPFEDYLVMGMGKAPLVLIYESQFIQKASLNDGSISTDMVLLYPDPSIYTEHVLVPLSEAGERLGELLTTDPELQRLAVEYGFRNKELSYFREFIRNTGLTIPDNLISIIQPPSYEVLEKMIQQIEQKY